MPERIERPIYLNKLIEFKDKDIVKIVTGIGRCGKKSTLLDLYGDYLRSSGVKAENILHMNMNPCSIGIYSVILLFMIM